MPPPSDPFSGLKLSEQTPLRQSTVGRDQRLFSTPLPAPRPAPAQPPPAPPEQQTTPTTVAPSADVMTSKPHGVKTSKRRDVTTSAQPAATPPFSATPVPVALDLNETPYRDFTLRLTEAEYEALDDLERELRRRFGIATSKNTLLRCGLHCLVADHSRSNDRSQVLQKLREITTHS